MAAEDSTAGPGLAGGATRPQAVPAARREDTRLFLAVAAMIVAVLGLGVFLDARIAGIEARITGLETRIDIRFTDVEAGLREVNLRLGRVEGRLDGVEGGIARIDSRLDRIANPAAK